MVTLILACVFSQLNFSGFLSPSNKPLNMAAFALASIGGLGRVQWVWGGCGCVGRIGEGMMGLGRVWLLCRGYVGFLEGKVGLANVRWGYA